MTSERSGFRLRFAPVLAFAGGVVICFSFWLGLTALATGAFRPQGASVSFAQAREAFFQTARDVTEGRSVSRPAR